MSESDHSNDNQYKPIVQGMGGGVALGLLMGILLDDLALGLALGLSIGSGFWYSLQEKNDRCI